MNLHIEVHMRRVLALEEDGISNKDFKTAHVPETDVHESSESFSDDIDA